MPSLRFGSSKVTYSQTRAYEKKGQSGAQGPSNPILGSLSP